MRRSFAASLIIILACLTQAQTAPANWTRQDSSAGGFTALFPIAPQEMSETKTVSQGDIVSHMFMANAGELFCLVGYTDYPVDVDTEQELAMDRDNFAKAVKATVSDSRRRSFIREAGDQFPALDFVATSDQGTFKGLVVQVNRRNYMAVAFYRKGSDRTADIERFFASFKLTGKKS
jgi:hypothetical protein